jgi:hypothetical protein
MNTIAIFCFPLDLELTSFGTLAKLVKTGHNVHVIVVGNNIKTWTRRCKYILYESCKTIGISNISFTEEFDYSSVTQNNALILKSVIQKVTPELVIIPFWKSRNHKLNILSKTSLIACRGIGNILMYNFSRNSKFNPNICVKLSKPEARAKLNRLLEYWPLLSRQFQRNSPGLFYPNIIHDHEEKVSVEIIARATIASFLCARVCSQGHVLQDSLKTEASAIRYGKKTLSSQVDSGTVPNKQAFNFSPSEGIKLSETYESHRVLLV